MQSARRLLGFQSRLVPGLGGTLRSIQRGTISANLAEGFAGITAVNLRYSEVGFGGTSTADTSVNGWWRHVDLLGATTVRVRGQDTGDTHATGFEVREVWP